RLEEIELVPKQRYRIMAPYMARVGTLGLRMMKQTATVQANIDYADERDAMRKLRVGMGLAPLLNAMFANSSLSDGGLNGYIGLRSADSQPPERMLALPALVKGVFYEADCLDAAYDLVKRWTYEETDGLWRQVHREALLARFRGVRVLELARELYAIAE